MTDKNEDETNKDAGECSTAIDFDVVLKYIGACGRYQLFLVLIVYYTVLPCGMHQVIAVFISAVPAFRCRIPEIDDIRDSGNLSYDFILNSTAPQENQKYDACHYYPRYPADCNASDYSCWNTTRQNSTVVSCTSYVFDTSTFTSTVSTEWELVCDRSVIGAISTAIYFCGVLIGAFVGGVVSDWIGRVPTLIGAQMGLSVIGIACSFTGSIITFTITRFLLATFVMPTMLVGFVYIVEITGGKWRTVLGILIQAAFAVGYMFLSPMSLQYRNWRELQLAISLVSCPALLFWFILPESPRWLLSQGKTKKAKQIICKIARRNNVTLPNNVWDLATVQKPLKKEHKYSPLVLLSLPRTRILTLNVAFIWFVISLIYYGLSLNVGSLAELSIVAVVLALSGKFAVSGAFAVIYNFTGELYPTVVRSTAVGVGSMSARIGSMFTPFALHLQNSVPWLTGTIFGTLALLGGGISIFLPETKGAPLLTTLLDAEEFYRQSRMNRKSTSSKAERAKNSVETEEHHAMI